MSMSTARPTFHAPVEGTVFCGDGREQRLLAMVEARSEALTGDPEKVLAAIDAFAEKEYLMNVGADKGACVEQIIEDRKPKLILEVGTYVGYSAIKFSRRLRSIHPSAVYPSEWPDKDSSQWPTELIGYVCLEKSEEYAAVAGGLLEIAGLSKVVKIITGPSTSSILELRNLIPALGHSKLTFDLVFLDHLKPLYTTDLKALEQSGLIGPGTTIVADNVIKPGNPRYLAYVRNKASANEEDDVDEVTGTIIMGSPELTYDSNLQMSWDPYTGEDDGMEISLCIKS